MFQKGDRVSFQNNSGTLLKGTVIERNPKCTAEWVVETEGGQRWNVHNVFIRDVHKRVEHDPINLVNQVNDLADALDKEHDHDFGD